MVRFDVTITEASLKFLCESQESPSKFDVTSAVFKKWILAIFSRSRVRCSSELSLDKITLYNLMNLTIGLIHCFSHSCRNSC